MTIYSIIKPMQVHWVLLVTCIDHFPVYFFCLVISKPLCKWPCQTINRSLFIHSTIEFYITIPKAYQHDPFFRIRNATSRINNKSTEQLAVCEVRKYQPKKIYFITG